MFLKDYYKAIQELSDEQFNRSIDYLIQNYIPEKEWFPVPGRLLKAVAETRLKPEVTPQDHQIPLQGVPMPESIKKLKEELNQKWSFNKKGVA